jgi:subtilase family serine protease
MAILRRTVGLRSAILGGALGVALAALAALALGSASAAGPGSSHRPVCPGPASADAARCHAHVRTDQAGKPLAAGGPVGFGPGQLRAAYGLGAAASSQTVAIVTAYNSTTIESDLAAYSSAFGLAPCTTANGCFRKVDQRGGTRYPKNNAGWALETALDVETVHGLCPTCRILLVEADSNSLANLGAAVDTAVRLGASVVSNSYGAPEFAGQLSYDHFYTHPGVAITVSSGDSGYGVMYPAASPGVTAVGGTTLRLNADGTRAAETAWAGAGSGCSAYSPKPAWQQDAGCIRRSVSDVSAVADPATGAAIYTATRYQGRKGWFTLGGTSLSAPIIGAVYALAGNAASQTGAGFTYSHAAALFDVVAGSNGGCAASYLCTAGPGYDGPTGLGAPNGTGGF